MLSVIITAYKEPGTIAKAIKLIADANQSGFAGKIEVIQVSPDEATLEVGRECADAISNPNFEFIQIQDPNSGKPIALNLALKQAKFDHILLTDGDVCFAPHALGTLWDYYKKKQIDAVCGRVRSVDDRASFWGYVSHLMTEAADHRRKIDLTQDQISADSSIRKNPFFPLTGYMMIFDKAKLEKLLNKSFEFPPDCLVDDAYLSYVMHNSGMRMGYCTEAEVCVQFPKNFSDYMKQKKRATGGFVQLWQYGVVNSDTKTRSFWRDLEYFWFPFQYAKTLREFFYSLLFYPVRFYLWFQIWIERTVLKKDFASTWVRIESTK